MLANRSFFIESAQTRRMTRLAIARQNPLKVHSENALQQNASWRRRGL
jgi:hypothetical protein